MTKEEIYAKLQEIIQEEKGEEVIFSLDTAINDTVAQDSVEVMELVLNIEDTFDIDVPDTAIEHFSTVSDIVDYIAEKINK